MKTTDGWSAVPNWVVRSATLTSHQKLVYISLLNHANAAGVSWPSIATLALEAGCSRRTVEGALAELAELGLIRREPRYLADGAQTSNRYRIDVWQGDPLRTTCAPPAQELRTPCAGAAHEVLPNEVLPNEVLMPTAEGGGPVLDVGTFDEFWMAYPRKVGKAAAVKAWAKALNEGANPAVVVAGARRLAADPNLPPKRYIPHPTTWLGRGGWDDEPYPARDGGAGDTVDELRARYREAEHG